MPDVTRPMHAEVTLPGPSGLLSQISPHELRLALRINDAAAMLGISRSSVYELIAEGKLKSGLIAGRRVIPMSECQRLIAESIGETP